MKKALLLFLLVLLGVSPSAQEPPQVQVFVSNVFCCGFTQQDIPGRSTPILAYNPAECNKVGPTGRTSVAGTLVTFDDPMNYGKVCVVDASSILTGLPPGMWDVATTLLFGVTPPGYFYNIQTQHRSLPFAAGGFIPLGVPNAPKNLRIVK